MTYLCSYCHRPIMGSAIHFDGKHFHAVENERGEHVNRGETCWDKSESGKKSL